MSSAAVLIGALRANVSHMKFAMATEENKVMMHAVLIFWVDKMSVCHFNILMLSMLGKISTGHILKYFFLFFQKTGFDISCKLSP